MNFFERPLNEKLEQAALACSYCACAFAIKATLYNCFSDNCSLTMQSMSYSLYNSIAGVIFLSCAKAVNHFYPAENRANPAPN